MKRLYHIILLACLALSGMAQTVGEAMYIYRNDGQINGFLPGEIQSIEYSYTDADGYQYDEIVTQIINTADSIYMIPLVEIDSISFVTPKTEYQPGVINLSDQLMPYVVSSDELTITFSSSTPSGLMPQVGDKLVTVEMNEKFSAGFAGEVVSVSGSQVTCKLVSLDEVLKTYYGVSSTYGYQEGDNTRLYNSRRAIDAYGNKDFKLGTFTWSKGAELSVKIFGSDKLALKGGTQLSIGITPSFHIMSTLIINDEDGIYLNACITSDITVQETVSIFGGIEFTYEPPINIGIKAPVAPYTFFYVKPGLFLRASATVSASATLTQRYTLGAAFDFSSKKRNVIKPACGGRLASSSFDMEGAIDGSLAVGGFVELGLTFIDQNIDKLCLRGELGAELVGHAVLYNSDVEEAAKETKVYERFKNSSIDLNAFATTSVQAELGPWGVSKSLPWNLSYNIKKWDVVPSFSDTSLKQILNPMTSADASVKMSGDCLFPVLAGLSLRDESGGEVGSYYPSVSFTNGNEPLETTFTGLSVNEKYKLYPKVRFLGYDMLASPSSDMKQYEFTVTTGDVDNLTANSATFHAQLNAIGQEMPGEVCFYYGTDGNPQFSGTIVSVGSAKNLTSTNFSANVANLKPNTTYYYVAAYNNGDISNFGEVKSFKTKKELAVVTRGATNITSNEATLYGGVDAEESVVSTAKCGFLYDTTSSLEQSNANVVYSSNMTGESFSTQLTGLTSNTTYYYRAFAQIGGVLFYGEVNSFKTKSDDDDPSAPIDLGLSVKWAAENYPGLRPFSTELDNGWRLPTSKECQELIEKCSSEWVVRNGVPGREFTAPNGNTIFFPARYSWENCTVFESNPVISSPEGRYWTSTHSDNPYGTDWFCWMYIGEDGADAETCWNLYYDIYCDIRLVHE